MIVLWMVLTGAETIEGDVAAVEPDPGFISVTRLNPVSGAPESFDVALNRGAAYEGIETLSDLKVGDTVRLEVSRGSAGRLEAGRLELTGSTGAEPETDSATPDHYVWGSQRKENLI
ncbi:MAG: hypothetical protein HY714_03055 [Candidatus Omnitrophica bacterium]|nr:hypothetical protein [Candidatus Omnitrophota bacterium]